MPWFVPPENLSIFFVRITENAFRPLSPVICSSLLSDDYSNPMVVLFHDLETWNRLWINRYTASTQFKREQF